MNISKIKTILIIALVITNIFLLFINSPDYNNKVNIDDELISALNKKNVKIDNIEFSFPSNIEKVFLSYENYLSDDIIRKMLGKNYMQKNNLFLNDSYYLDLENKNQLIFSKRGVSLSENTTSIEEAKKISKEFLKQKDFYSTDLDIQKVVKQKEFISIYYNQYYKNRFIENSSMILKVSNGEVILFRRKWFEVQSGDFHRNEIIPLERIIYKFIKGYKEESVKTIEKIELGYILEDNIFVQNIQSGEGFPYYRLKFNNGQYYYIEAIER
ncbi:MAG: hypothetical protein ACQEQE_09055 [Bacillota bacterium]